MNNDYQPTIPLEAYQQKLCWKMNDNYQQFPNFSCWKAFEWNWRHILKSWSSSSGWTSWGSSSSGWTSPSEQYFPVGKPDNRQWSHWCAQQSKLDTWEYGFCRRTLILGRTLPWLTMRVWTLCTHGDTWVPKDTMDRLLGGLNNMNFGSRNIGLWFGHPTPVLKSGYLWLL